MLEEVCMTGEQVYIYSTRSISEASIGPKKGSIYLISLESEASMNYNDCFLQTRSNYIMT